MCPVFFILFNLTVSANNYFGNRTASTVRPADDKPFRKTCTLTYSLNLHLLSLLVISSRTEGIIKILL